MSSLYSEKHYLKLRCGRQRSWRHSNNQKVCIIVIRIKLNFYDHLKHRFNEHKSATFAHYNIFFHFSFLTHSEIYSSFCVVCFTCFPLQIKINCK